MKIAIEFNLTEDTVIVHWPWGAASFYTSAAGISSLTEALRNFSIESTRAFPRGAPQCVRSEDLVAIRKAMEGHGDAKVTRLDEHGRKKLPSLAALFGDDDMFMVPANG